MIDTKEYTAILFSLLILIVPIAIADGDKEETYTNTITNTSKVVENQREIREDSGNLTDISSPTKVTYDFDDVEVIYGAEFQASKDLDGIDTWVDSIQGEGGEINILFGVVNLMNGNEIAVREDFIRVEGPEGFERFLSNSVSFGYYDSGRIKSIRTQFWSAKKLEGTQVVKDFTEPVKSVTLSREFDENGEITRIYLQFIDGADKTTNAFWSENKVGQLYLANLDTLSDTGDPTATATR